MVLTCFCMLVESSQESAQFMWKQHFSPDPDLDTVVSVHEEDLPVSQSCYTMSSSLSSFIVASTMACLVPATLTVVRDCSWYSCFLLKNVHRLIHVTSEPTIALILTKGRGPILGCLYTRRILL